MSIGKRVCVKPKIFYFQPGFCGQSTDLIFVQQEYMPITVWSKLDRFNLFRIGTLGNFGSRLRKSPPFGVVITIYPPGLAKLAALRRNSSGCATYSMISVIKQHEAIFKTECKGIFWREIATHAHALNEHNLPLLHIERSKSHERRIPQNSVRSFLVQQLHR